MFEVYTIYGLYNDDTMERIEEGDHLKQITFYNSDCEETKLKKIKISDIYDNRIIVETSDYDEVTIDIDDIIDWEI